MPDIHCPCVGVQAVVRGSVPIELFPALDNGWPKRERFIH